MSSRFSSAAWRSASLLSCGWHVSQSHAPRRCKSKMVVKHMVFLSHPSSTRLVWCDPAVTASFRLIKGILFCIRTWTCETQPEPFLASIELTLSLQNVFSHVPDIGATEFQAYSTGEARQSVLGSLRMELAELPDVQHMSQTTLDAHKTDCRVLLVHHARHISRVAILPTHSYRCSLVHVVYHNVLLHSHWALPYSVVSGNAFLGTR